MRALIFNWKDIRHPAAGGAEVYTHEVARRWSADGHEVTLFAAAAPGLPRREVLDGVTIVRDGGRLGVYWAARRFYLHERPEVDVVIDEVNTRPFFCHRWVHGTPVVALIHQVAAEIWHHETPAPIALAGRYVLEPRWLRRYRDVPTLTVSESSRQSLVAAGLRDVAVVPVGIGLPASLPAPAKAPHPMIAFVGRLTGSKRPDHALASFVGLRRALPDAELHVIGDGPQRSRLERRVPEGVVFHGRVGEADKFSVLSRAHALVVTSVREGWGLVVDEAAAVGTVSVGYDVPGLRDSIPAADGYLVSPDPGAMAAELERILPGLVTAPHTRGWTGGAVSWDAVAEAVLDHIHHLLPV